ncbi:MAG: thioredoxin domain-containing protein [Anaerolineae bacterium]
MATRTSSVAPKPKANKQQNLTMIVVVVVAALVVAGLFIAFSLNNPGASSDIDYASIPQTRLADGGFVLGDPEAPVTIVEFADFLCPHCQDYKSTIDQFIEEFVVTGQARFEYRMYPTQGPNAIYAAQAAECAEILEPGSFWEAHDELFALASRGIRDERISRQLADSLDLNYSDLLLCIRDEAEQVQTDQALGSRSQVEGTPAVRIRYGDSAPQVIPGFDRGGPPLSVLRAQVVGAGALSQSN